MNSLWRAIGLGGSSIPNFEFTFEENAPVTTLSSDALLPWTMRPAKRESDGLVVTVFSINLTGRDASSAEMARNVLKKCKTLMLPGFLRTYDATEYKEHIYIATESVVPLQSVISNDSAKIEFYEEASGERYNNAVALGLKYVAQALNAIHKHNLVHGNVGPEEVFVTKGGEWKLFGLELVGEWNAPHSLLKRNAALLPEYRRAAVMPEGGGAASSGGGNIYDVDAWGLGCLIYTVFTSSAASLGSRGIKVADMRGCRTMPRTLQSAFMGLTASNPKLRLSFGKFLEECEFISGSEYVQMVTHLDNLAVMDAVDRDALYRRLATQLDGVPLCACKHIVLAKLLAALSFGGGSAAVLEPILKIGARLPAEEFSAHVGPIVTNMFQSPDHLVRCRLLSSASQYARLLPADLVSEKIYPHYATGFTSRHADIRELTVRALVDFAPLLCERILVNDVPRLIGVLQQDREGPIRTNATICLSMIAGTLPESVRSKTLVNGFGRMLKDPFVPSRTAALKSIASTIDVYASNQLAEMLLPAVAPCAVDPHAEVREAALALMGDMVRRLGEFHKMMPAVGPDGQPLGTPQTPAPAPPPSSTGWGSFFAGTGGSSDVASPTASVRSGGSPTPTPTAAASSASPAPAPVAKPLSRPTALPTTATTTTAAVSKPSVAATAPAASAAKAGGGWADDDDDMWGDAKSAPGPAPTASSSAAAASPAPPRRPTSTAAVGSSQQQQMDDFFSAPVVSTGGGPRGVASPTASLNSTLNSGGGGGGVARPAAGGAMKLGLGGSRKLGLGGAAKSE